jgi:hypothetical protein
MSRIEAAPAANTRTTRRQEETRKRLVEATHVLLAQGEEKVTIQAITAAADVGAGTFYNYFQNREEIFDAVVDDAVESLGRRLDAMTHDMTDAAEIYSFSLRHLMGMAVTDPVWGWLVVHLGIAHSRLIGILGPRAKRDLMIGIKSKRFSIPDVDMATAITFGALLSAIYTHLENPTKKDPSALFAETMLLMVGISPEEAKRVTSLPMPKLPDLD